MQKESNAKRDRAEEQPRAAAAPARVRFIGQRAHDRVVNRIPHFNDQKIVPTENGSSLAT